MASDGKSWGKIIFTSRFCLKMIEEGMAVSSGVLMPELIKHLGSSSATTGLLISLHISLWYLAAPLAQLLLEHSDRPRRVTTVCGLLAGLFITFTAFTKNVFIFGLLLVSSGLCASVLHRQAPLLLHQYFPTNFTFISISTFFGAIAGGLLLPQMISLSLMAYGVSGALLILGGVFLHLIPIGYALKVPTNSSEDLGGDNGEDTIPSISKDVNANGRGGSDKNILDEVCKEECERPKRTFEVNELDDRVLSDHDNRPPRSPDNISSDRFEGDGENHGNDNGYNKDKNKKKGAEKQARSTSTFSRLKEITRIDFLIKNPLVSCTLLPSVVIINVVVGGWDLFEVTYGISQGLEPRTASFIPMASIAGCAMSHILLIIILRHRPTYCVYIFFFSCCLFSLGFFLMTLFSSVWYLMLMSFVTGLGMNGVIVTSEGVIEFVIDKDSFAHGSTLTDLFSGLGLLLSGFVAGYITDVSGSMKTLYYSLGGINLLACLLMLILLCKVSCT